MRTKIKTLLLFFAISLLLLGNVISTKAASNTPYDGYGKINAWAYDTSEEWELVTSGAWPSNGLTNQDDGFSCHYMWNPIDGLGWSNPSTWYIFKNSGGKWIDFTWNGDTNYYYLKNAWMELNGEWYFAKDNGYLASGWTYIPKTALTTPSGTVCGWFYFDPVTCTMQDGWQYIDNKWYYLNQNDTFGWTEDEYMWGECLYDERGISELITVPDTNLSFYGKTARYVTGFHFTVHTYIEGDNDYSLESTTPYTITLGSGTSCEKTVIAPVKTGYTLNTSKSSPATITNSLHLVKNGSMASTLNKTDVNWYYSRNASTLTLHGNGGGGHTPKVTLLYNSKNNSDLSSNLPTRNGYTFKGWYTAPSGGTQIYNASGYVVNDGTYWKNERNIYTKDYVLYAQWDANTYTITYNANGGILNHSSTASFKCDSPVNLSPTCTKDGKLFAGWGLSPNDTTPLSSLTMPAEHTTLYALYSLPVSDLQKAILISWSTQDPNIYNSYPLTLTKTINGTYTYTLSGIDLTKGLTYSDANELKRAILLYDNAGNHSILPIDEIVDTDVPIPHQYLQTVEHYLWNLESQSWIYYASTSELAYENSTFTPAYLQTTPAGYHQDSIDDAYIVTGETVKAAYYRPDSYTLFFDANGGSCDTASKTVYKDYFYGDLPTAARKGYTFQGWYTSASDGSHILGSDRYTQTTDSTIYAHWKINTHNVIYDYAANGGNSVDLPTKDTAYGTAIDLSVKAYKPGWTFVGWNTDPNATTGLEHMPMPDERVILYAIYSKTITVTFLDTNDYGSKLETNTQTIYNRQQEAAFTVPMQHNITGWNALGWSTDTKADADIEIFSDTIIYLSENQIFYGCYVKDVTLNYDTNGSAEVIASQTKERFFNSFGNYKNPAFTIADAPKLPQHSFVNWITQDSTNTNIQEYHPSNIFEFEKDTILIAKWDQYPVIEAYDRYFTLEDAQSGKITEEELLKKVIATDREDGTLINGRDVIIKDYHVTDFSFVSTNKNVSVTYLVRDIFGNFSEKTITVHIVDTSVHKSPIISYSRFISHEFFLNENELIPKEEGGLESSSIWRNNPNYQHLLEQTLERVSPEQSFSFTQ